MKKFKIFFPNKELNAAIQQAVDAEGNVDWSRMPSVLQQNAEIVGLDRQNAGTAASEWVELILIKKKCSPGEADAILELLQIRLINECTNETGLIYEYDASSVHAAVLMNLPAEVLNLIPLKDRGFRNDKQGSEPKEFGEWIIRLVQNTIRFLTDLIIAIGECLAAIVEAAAEAGMKFVEQIKEAVMALIEAIVKAALLALIYLIFALILLSLIHISEPTRPY